MVFIQYLFK